MERLSRKEEGLMDTDNSVVIVAGRKGVRGLKGNVKNTMNITLKNKIQNLKKIVSLFL